MLEMNTAKWVGLRSEITQPFWSIVKVWKWRFWSSQSTKSTSQNKLTWRSLVYDFGKISSKQKNRPKTNKNRQKNRPKWDTTYKKLNPQTILQGLKAKSLTSPIDTAGDTSSHPRDLSKKRSSLELSMLGNGAVTPFPLSSSWPVAKASCSCSFKPKTFATVAGTGTVASTHVFSTKKHSNFPKKEDVVSLTQIELSRCGGICFF